MAKAATATKPGKSGKQPAKSSAKGAKAPKATRAPKAAKPAPEPAQADFLGTESSNVVDLGAGVKVREATAAEVADFMGSTTEVGIVRDGVTGDVLGTVGPAGPVVETTEGPTVEGPDGLLYPADYVAPGLVHHSGDMYADENGVLVDRFGREIFPPEDETQDPGESGEVVEPAFEPDPELTAEENDGLAAGTHYVEADASVQPKPAAGIGHNNPPPDEEPVAAAGQLKAFVERIERLEDEKAAIALDTKEVFAELKGAGFNAKIVRKILAIKKRDHSELQEENAIMQVYAQALGLDFLV